MNSSCSVSCLVLRFLCVFLHVNRSTFVFVLRLVTLCFCALSFVCCFRLPGMTTLQNDMIRVCVEWDTGLYTLAHGSTIDTCREIFPQYFRGYPLETPPVREHNVLGIPAGKKYWVRTAVEGKIVEGKPAVKFRMVNSGCITIVLTIIIIIVIIGLRKFITRT